MRKAQVEQALGRTGRDMGAGVFQVTVPRAEVIYMHFWAVDLPAKLAQGLEAALDQMNGQR